MVNRFILFVFVLYLLISCQNKSSFKIINPLKENRKDEVVVLSRSYVESLIELNDNKSLVLRSGNSLIPFQLDDLDGDEKWDELACLIDISALEKKVIRIEEVPKNQALNFEKRTNLQLGIYQDEFSYKEVDYYKAIPYTEEFKVIAQGEGVNWENDKIAFRVYFDCRNVKDLFGKRKPEMIIDKIHTREIENYHILNDWGMDILHCGNSLGAGGIALLKKDSLYRLGSTEDYEYIKITEGPVRSICDLVYKGWHVDDDVLEATERITITPGKYWFQSDVTVKNAPEGTQIVTGIVTSKLKREPFKFDYKLFSCIGTHDKQSMNQDELGMAILIPKDKKGIVCRTTDVNYFDLGYKTVPSKGFSNVISETYYLGQHFTNGKPIRHYFFSVWGLENTRWETEDGFRNYISQEAAKLSSPLLVK